MDTPYFNVAQIAKMVAEDGAVFDSFGRSVAISGDTMVIGACGGQERRDCQVVPRAPPYAAADDSSGALGGGAGVCAEKEKKRGEEEEEAGGATCSRREEE